ncbi:MAG: hypothetical protein IPL07_12960 [Acidimicrobiaceae bacterium]|nr:hypothetical protein [Acidimicrobiaceae bacterium]
MVGPNASAAAAAWGRRFARPRRVGGRRRSPAPSVKSLGIDVEPTDPLAAEIGGVILRDDERAMDAHLAFALKEAAYKAWSTGGGRMLDHQRCA